LIAHVRGFTDSDLSGVDLIIQLSSKKLAIWLFLIKNHPFVDGKQCLHAAMEVDVVLNRY